MPLRSVNSVAPSKGIGLAKPVPNGVCLLMTALVGVIGFVVLVGIYSSAVVENICRSRLLTRCLMVNMSPTLDVRSRDSLSNAVPISKLKYSADFDAHIWSGCESVPANHNLFS